MGKDLKDKAIKYKDKDYVLVSDRVIYFNDTYPKGAITTELITEPDSDLVIVKATVFPEDSQRKFTGYSQAVKGDGFVNKTAALENAETSAVGRALAFMGIGVLDSIASADEINKATGSTGKRPTLSDKQLSWLRAEAGRVSGIENGEDLDAWIEQELNYKLSDIPGYKAKDAVDKIRSVGERGQEELRARAQATEDAAEVTDQDIKDLDDGKLPY